MADAVLQYDFAVVGVKNVERAFSSIERRAAQHNARMNRAFGTRGQGGSGSAPKKSTQSSLMAEARKQAGALAHVKRIRERHENDITRRVTQEGKHRARVELDIQKQLERQRKRVSDQAIRERQRVSKSLFGAGARSIRGSVGAIGRTAAGALTVGGAVGAGVAIDTQKREIAMASQLANQAGRPGQKRDILSRMRGVSGFTGTEAGSALGSFMDLTGDIDTGMKIMKELGNLALATGANFDDVASAAGNFSNNLKDIKDPAKRAEKVLEVMRGLAGQGMAGAVELKDLAGGGAIIGAAAQAMAGGNMATNIKSAGALAQAARAEGGAASADEALRATQRFMDFAALGGANKRLTKMGIDTLQDGKVRDPVEIIADYYEKSKGKGFAKATEVFGQMGGRVVRGFGSAFETGGRSGVRSRFNELMQTELGAGDVASRAASRLSDPDIQFKEAMKDFNREMGEQLLPVVIELVPLFRELIPYLKGAAEGFAYLVSELIDSPLTTLGTLIAAKLAADLAAAQIGNVVKGALEGAISGSGTGGLTGKGSGALGKLIAVGLVAEAAMIGHAIGKAMADWLGSEWERSSKHSSTADLTAVNALSGSRSLAEKRAALDALDTDINRQSSEMTSFSGIMGNVLGGAHRIAYGGQDPEQAAMRESLDTRKKLQDQILQLEQQQSEARSREITAMGDHATAVENATARLSGSGLTRNSGSAVGGR